MQLLLEEGELWLSPDEPRSPGGGGTEVGYTTSGSFGRIEGLLAPLHLNRRDGLRNAFQAHRPDSPETEPAPGADEAPDEIACQDAPTPAGVTESPRHDDRRAMEVGVLLEGLPSVDTDADAERSGGVVTVVLVHAQLDLHGAPQGIEGAREGGHHPVAQSLDLLAVGGLDGAAEDREVGPAQYLSSVVAEAGEELGRADEVGEDERHHTARGGPHRGDVAGQCRRPLDARFVTQDRALQLRQPGARLDTQFLDQQPPQFLVAAERVGLAAGPVEGEHALTPKAFPEGMGASQGVELGGELDVAATGKIGVHSVLERDEARLFQTGGFRLGERGVGQVGQRPATPQTEGLAERLGRLAVIA